MTLPKFIPYVEEASAIGISIASAGVSRVLSEIPSIHGKQIDFMFSCTGNDIDVVVEIFGANGKIQSDFVAGTVVAGNTGTYVQTAFPALYNFVGQYFSLKVTNNNGQGTAAAAIVNAWAAVRS